MQAAGKKDLYTPESMANPFSSSVFTAIAQRYNEPDCPLDAAKNSAGAALLKVGFLPPCLPLISSLPDLPVLTYFPPSLPEQPCFPLCLLFSYYLIFSPPSHTL